MEKSFTTSSTVLKIIILYLLEKRNYSHAIWESLRAACAIAMLDDAPHYSITVHTTEPGSVLLCCLLASLRQPTCMCAVPPPPPALPEPHPPPLPHTCNIKQCYHRSGVLHTGVIFRWVALDSIAAAGGLAQLSGESVRAWHGLAVWFQSLRSQCSDSCLQW